MLEVSPAFRRRARLASALWSALTWPARVAEARRTLARFGAMTDRELADVGLLRSDLAAATALPPHVEPGRRLAEARGARARFAPRRCERIPSLFAPFGGQEARLPRLEGGKDGQGTELCGA